MNVQLVVFDMAGTTVYDGDAVNVCLRGALQAADIEGIFSPGLTQTSLDVHPASTVLL